MNEPTSHGPRAPLGEVWTEERAARVGQLVRRRLHQRRRIGVALSVAAVAAVLTAVVSTGLLARVSPAPNVLVLSDGSTVTSLKPETALVALADEEQRVAIRLDRGAARFDVMKRPRRTFRVEALPVAVEVIGTRFVVERLADTVRVIVEEGRVRVVNAGRATELGAGQSGLFALAAPQVAPAPADEDPPVVAAEPVVNAPSRAESVPRTAADWRAPAERGEFERAFAMLERGSVRDDPQDLLLASDVARLSGHPRQARDHLVALLDRHPKDTRAPLAAFTLGRVLLDQLGWPRDAAQAFARVRVLDPNGPLTEDALAREVEAWSRAGDAARARAAAERYLASYPNGARVAAVRRYGGL